MSNASEDHAGRLSPTQGSQSSAPRQLWLHSTHALEILAETPHIQARPDACNFAAAPVESAQSLHPLDGDRAAAIAGLPPRLLSLTDGKELGSADWATKFVRNTFIHIAPWIPPSQVAGNDDWDIVYTTYRSAIKVPQERASPSRYGRNGSKRQHEPSPGQQKRRRYGLS